jgi:dTDP-glucose 4,6-dehydratase
MLELAHTLAGLAPERGLTVTAKAPATGYLASAVDRNLPDISKLQALGWQPAVGIAEGFRRVIAHQASLGAR